MLNKIVFSLLFAFAMLQAMGQTGFTVGYHYGYANPKEVNRVLHAYNLRNETILTDKMPAVHWFKGYSIGAQIKGFGRSGMEMMWVGREAIVSAQGKDATGAIVQRDIKITSNSFNIGQYFKIGSANKFIWGYSFDFGVRFRGYTRKAEPSQISSTEWTKLFNVESNPFQVIFNMVPTAYTLYGQANIGPIGVRLWYQFQGIKQTTDILDYTLLGTYVRGEPFGLHDKFSNIGISANILLGKRGK